MSKINLTQLKAAAENKDLILGPDVLTLIECVERMREEIKHSVNYFESIGLYKREFSLPDNPPEAEDCMARDFKEALAFVDEKVEL